MLSDSCASNSAYADKLFDWDVCEGAERCFAEFTLSAANVLSMTRLYVTATLRLRLMPIRADESAVCAINRHLLITRFICLYGICTAPFPHRGKGAVRVETVLFFIWRFLLERFGHGFRCFGLADFLGACGYISDAFSAYLFCSLAQFLRCYYLFQSLLCQLLASIFQ